MRLKNFYQKIYSNGGSGTQPVIRVMVEASSDEVCGKYIEEMSHLIQSEGLSV